MNATTKPGVPEIAKDWTLSEAVHHNGAPVFFAYTMQCDQEPRLTRFDRYERKTRSITSTWRVDGVDQPSLEAACAALSGGAA